VIRVLVAHGCTQAALTWPGGLGAFVAGSGAHYRHAYGISSESA